MSHFLRTALAAHNPSTKLFAIAAGFVVVAGGLFYAANSYKPQLPVLQSSRDAAPTGSLPESADLERLIDRLDLRSTPRTISLAAPYPHPRPAASEAVKPPKPAEFVVGGIHKDKIDSTKTETASTVERPNTCASACDTRKPLVRSHVQSRPMAAPAAAGPMPVSATQPATTVQPVVASQPAGSPEPSGGEKVLVEGRDMLAWIVAVPSATLDAGKGAISQLTSAIR